MQDIGQRLSRIPLTGLLVIALAISACSGGSASNSAAGTSSPNTTGTTGTTVTAAGTATLTWVAPTQNADGTPVTDLAGYTLYYGTNPSDLTQSITVSGAASTTTEVKDLAAGTYYFAVAAYNAMGLESQQSNVASATT
jgi:hypothetical protein